MNIDWSRIAEPQADQYDTQTIWHLATTATTPHRTTFHVPRESGDAPTLFDGRVAVRYLTDRCPGFPDNTDGPLDHPNLDLAAAYVGCWPAAYEQFAALIDSIHPMWRRHISPDNSEGATGSSSHSYEDVFGAIFATVYDPLGTAQAFVHEMAHHKLRAMGVHLELATRLITNPRQDTYESPIRKDRARPMTAVFHAEYAFIHVTELDIQMLKAATCRETADKIRNLLARNVPRMEAGYDLIRRHIQTDADGRIFVHAFMNWADRVISEGHGLLTSA